MQSIIFQEQHLAALRAHLLQDLQREYAAFLLGGSARWEGGTKILVREVVPIPEQGFLRQDDGGLVIAPAFFNAIMKRASADGRSVILTHSHPGARGHVAHSPIDDAGEHAMFGNLNRRVPDHPHASMVFGQDAVAARIWHADGTFSAVERLVSVGQRLDVTYLQRHVSKPAELHDRQARAFGFDGHRRIVETTCAVVGAGGTGSVTAEQLIRLGVHRLLIIDDDAVEQSNVSRIYGSRMWDARWATRKVSVLERLAEEIGIGTEVVPIDGNVLDPAIALQLRQVDVVFACTDSHWSRALLNQFCDQYLVPVIDMGNRIDAPGGAIAAAHGRVYVVRPGEACLWCFDAIRSTTVAEEALPPDERERRADEGYVRGVGIPDPSVISLNTVVAGVAVTEFLNLVTGFMGRSGPQPQLTYRMLENTITAGVYRPDTACDCYSGRLRALGDAISLPTRPGAVTATVA